MANPSAVEDSIHWSIFYSTRNIHSIHWLSHVMVYLMDDSLCLIEHHVFLWKKESWHDSICLNTTIFSPERRALSISSGVDDFAIKNVVVEQPGLSMSCSFDQDWSWFWVISVRTELLKGKRGSSRANRSPSRLKNSEQRGTRMKERRLAKNYKYLHWLIWN